MAKTKPLKKWHVVVFILIIITAIIFRIYQYMWPNTFVKIGGQTLKVLVAKDYDHLYEGWGNKKDMGKYQGMLFVFPNSDEHAMVMRSMRFPLDMVWIDGNKIVEIAPNVQPEPGKTEDRLTPYFSGHPSNYVLELPAGFMDKTGIKIGDEVVISGY